MSTTAATTQNQTIRMDKTMSEFDKERETAASSETPAAETGGTPAQEAPVSAAPLPNADSTAEPTPAAVDAAAKPADGAESPAVA